MRDRWVLFPPGTARHLVKPDDYSGVDREALSWFQGVLPRLIVEHPEVARTRIDFIQRMRMNRLISTAIENPGELSIGIDESTAIIVENDSAKVVGAAQVIVLKNTKNDKKTLYGLLGARDLELSVILPGERFAL